MAGRPMPTGTKPMTVLLADKAGILNGNTSRMRLPSWRGVVTIVEKEVSMAYRTSDAVWQGDLKHGKGTIKLGSGAFEDSYSFASRFEEGDGTNPEELIAAAH